MEPTAQSQSTVHFQDLTLIPVPLSNGLEWSLTTADVAAGFGCSVSRIRMAKARHKSELMDGRHFIPGDRSDNGRLLPTLWTKRGIVRLGFLIHSPRAKAFRDFAEDLVLASDGSISQHHQAPQPDLATVIIERDMLLFRLIEVADPAAFRCLARLARSLASAACASPKALS